MKVLAIDGPYFATVVSEKEWSHALQNLSNL
jgi:hypothetical protein